MTFALKPLRLLLATGASVLAFGGGTALAAPSPVGTPDPLDVQAPDCVTTCTKTLQPGQRLVVAGRYAFQSATINGTASGFGARFAVKRSPDGTTYSKLYESPFMTSLGPLGYSQPGYYRAIAINDSTWLTTTVTITVNTR